MEGHGEEVGSFQKGPWRMDEGGGGQGGRGHSKPQDRVASACLGQDVLRVCGGEMGRLCGSGCGSQAPGAQEAAGGVTLVSRMRAGFWGWAGDVVGGPPHCPLWGFVFSSPWGSRGY